MSESPDTPPEASSPKEDTAWANKWGNDLRPIALKYGREVFEFTMAVGTTQHAAELIMRRIRGNNELTKALYLLTNNANKFAVLAMNKGNFGQEFRKCKQEIESTTPSVVAPAGQSIILPQ